MSGDSATFNIKSLSDPRLTEAIRARDPEAIRLVVTTYLDHILHAAQGAGLSDERAEDITQDTFTTFIEKAPTFEGRSHVRTFVFGILYRKLMQEHRHTQKRQMHDDIDEVVESRFSNGKWTQPPERIDLNVHRGEVRDQIEDCLETVPERQRMAFVLKEIEGFTTDEACKVLEVTRTNLGALLSRSRNRLRECLEGKGLRGSQDASL
jgi:RNA polymerase sigma-70 factor (ECF subfamily)